MFIACTGVNTDVWFEVIRYIEKSAKKEHAENAGAERIKREMCVYTVHIQSMIT